MPTTRDHVFHPAWRHMWRFCVQAVRVDTQTHRHTDTQTQTHGRHHTRTHTPVVDLCIDTPSARIHRYARSHRRARACARARASADEKLTLLVTHFSLPIISAYPFQPRAPPARKRAASAGPRKRTGRAARPFGGVPPLSSPRGRANAVAPRGSIRRVLPRRSRTLRVLELSDKLAPD